MSTPQIVTLIVVGWCLLLLLVVALCKAAADGDEFSPWRGPADTSADVSAPPVADTTTPHGRGGEGGRSSP